MFDTTANVLALAAGVGRLLAGRRLFWLFVGLVGFVAIVVAHFALWLFEGALIFLSSLVGAGLIVDSLDVRAGISNLVLLGLTALGIAVQAGLTARRRRSPTLSTQG